MAGLRDKFKKLLAPTLAAMTLTLPQTSQAEHAPKDVQQRTPSITKTTTSFDKYTSFLGKDFDTRMLMAEKMSQCAYIQNHVFQDVFSMILKDATAGAHINDITASEMQELVSLGKPLSQVNTSLSYEEQLRSCGFDVLADIQAGHKTMDNLSALEQARVIAQLEQSEILGNHPNNERQNTALKSRIYNDNLTLNFMSQDTSILNGHNLSGTTLYETQIAQQAAQNIRNEQIMLHQKSAQQKE